MLLAVVTETVTRVVAVVVPMVLLIEEFRVATQVAIVNAGIAVAVVHLVRSL